MMEDELQKAGKSISNLLAYTDKTLLIASQLGRLWQEGDFETREKLQYLSFQKECSMSIKMRHFEPEE
jgi:hypothetical protein